MMFSSAKGIKRIFVNIDDACGGGQVDDAEQYLVHLMKNRCQVGHVANST